MPCTRDKHVVVSPLRYPGAKRRFVPLIRDTIEANKLTPKLFVEPFAGGASVSLQLLSDGVVEKIGLAEADPLVASFWSAVFWDTEWLVRKIRTAKVTVEIWRRLKAATLETDRDRAFACLFLNRTSFSGILSPTAGPLGGQNQESEYSIDCRFPKETLVGRVRRIGKLRSRVTFVRQSTWQETLSHVQSLGIDAGAVFYYLDPPFYEKADRLYGCYFEDKDHVELRDALRKLESPWFLSYDPADRILELYSENGTSQHVEVLYSAGTNAEQAARREIVVTNLPSLPVSPLTRMLRSAKRTAELRSAHVPVEVARI